MAIDGLESISIVLVDALFITSLIENGKIIYT